MSNQILIDLYKEAAEFAYKICKEEGREGGPSDHIWNTLSTGKFAELIVQECVDIIQKEVSMKYKDGGETEEFIGGHYAASVLARTKIKQHFGVE